MSKISEKECPFKLPLKLSNWTGHEKYVDVVDALGELIAYRLSVDQAKFLVLACNSYFEQAARIKELVGTLKFIEKKRDDCRKGIPLTKADKTKLDERLEAALKGDTNEGN